MNPANIQARGAGADGEINPSTAAMNLQHASSSRVGYAHISPETSKVPRRCHHANPGPPAALIEDW